MIAKGVFINLLLWGIVHCAPQFNRPGNQNQQSSNEQVPSFFYNQVPFIYNPYPNPFYSYNYQPNPFPAGLPATDNSAKTEQESRSTVSDSIDSNSLGYAQISSNEVQNEQSSAIAQNSKSAQTFQQGSPFRSFSYQQNRFLVGSPAIGTSVSNELESRSAVSTAVGGSSESQINSDKAQSDQDSSVAENFKSTQGSSTFAQSSNVSQIPKSDSSVKSAEPERNSAISTAYDYSSSSDTSSSDNGHSDKFQSSQGSGVTQNSDTTFAPSSKFAQIYDLSQSSSPDVQSNFVQSSNPAQSSYSSQSSYPTLSSDPSQSVALVENVNSDIGSVAVQPESIGFRSFEPVAPYAVPQYLIPAPIYEPQFAPYSGQDSGYYYGNEIPVNSVAVEQTQKKSVAGSSGTGKSPKTDLKNPSAVSSAAISSGFNNAQIINSYKSQSNQGSVVAQNSKSTQAFKPTQDSTASQSSNAAQSSKLDLSSRFAYSDGNTVASTSTADHSSSSDAVNSDNAQNSDGVQTAQDSTSQSSKSTETTVKSLQSSKSAQSSNADQSPKLDLSTRFANSDGISGVSSATPSCSILSDHISSNKAQSSGDTQNSQGSSVAQNSKSTKVIKPTQGSAFTQSSKAVQSSNFDINTRFAAPEKSSTVSSLTEYSSSSGVVNPDKSQNSDTVQSVQSSNIPQNSKSTKTVKSVQSSKSTESTKFSQNVKPEIRPKFAQSSNQGQSSYLSQNTHSTKNSYPALTLDRSQNLALVENVNSDTGSIVVQPESVGFRSFEPVAPYAVPQYPIPAPIYEPQFAPYYGQDLGYYYGNEIPVNSLAVEQAEKKSPTVSSGTGKSAKTDLENRSASAVVSIGSSDAQLKSSKAQSNQGTVVAQKSKSTQIFKSTQGSTSAKSSSAVLSPTVDLSTRFADLERSNSTVSTTTPNYSNSVNALTSEKGQSLDKTQNVQGSGVAQKAKLTQVPKSTQGVTYSQSSNAAQSSKVDDLSARFAKPEKSSIVSTTVADYSGPINALKTDVAPNSDKTQNVVQGSGVAQNSKSKQTVKSVPSPVSSQSYIFSQNIKPDVRTNFVQNPNPVQSSYSSQSSYPAFSSDPSQSSALVENVNSDTGSVIVQPESVGYRSFEPVAPYVASQYPIPAPIYEPQFAPYYEQDAGYYYGNEIPVNSLAVEQSVNKSPTGSSGTGGSAKTDLENRSAVSSAVVSSGFSSPQVNSYKAQSNQGSIVAQNSKSPQAFKSAQGSTTVQSSNAASPIFAVSTRFANSDGSTAVSTAAAGYSSSSNAVSSEKTQNSNSAQTAKDSISQNSKLTQSVSSQQSSKSVQSSKVFQSVKPDVRSSLSQSSKTTKSSVTAPSLKSTQNSYPSQYSYPAQISYPAQSSALVENVNSNTGSIVAQPVPVDFRSSVPESVGVRSFESSVPYLVPPYPVSAPIYEPQVASYYEQDANYYYGNQIPVNSVAVEQSENKSENLVQDPSLASSYKYEV